MFLFFFIRSGAKVSEPGKGPNHLGEGWRERNGVYKALLSLSFCDHHLLKRKLYCWLIGLVWKGQCLCRKILVPSFPITLSRYYIFFFLFFFILYHKKWLPCLCRLYKCNHHHHGSCKKSPRHKIQVRLFKFTCIFFKVQV